MDAVITWVDGRDPEHSKKLQKYMDRDQPHLLAAEPTRYRESGEIYFCLASIIKFAPFIQRIFIVTDNQTPARLEEFIERWKVPQDFITLVDHKDIFCGFEEFLPTFNSITIETMLYRIPDLSNEFIYFNDDFFLIRPVTSTDFFSRSGPVMRGSLRKYYKDRFTISLRTKIRKLLGTYKDKPGYRTSQQISGLMVGGLEKFLQIGHNPHSVRRQTLGDYFDSNPNILPQQLKHHFRHHEQFSMVALANHLEIRNGIEPSRPAHALYIKAAGRSVKYIEERFDKAEEQEAKWGCIQSLDEADEEVRTLIMEKLRELVLDFPEE